MASFISSKNVVILALALAICVQGIVGGAIECENLNKDSCSFAVSSSGKRCVLEKSVKRSGEETYTCRASEIEADKLKDWVETDQCIDSCGLERAALGISSDSLLEAHFLQKLCSAQCYNSCPNIVDLYFNLAAGEGVFLPKLCEARGENGRRGLAEFKSSAHVAPGPGGVHPAKYTVAPSPYGHPEKYTVAPSPYDHPEKYTVAPSPYGHPEKYTVAPSPYGHPEKYTVAPSPYDHPEKYTVAPSPYDHPEKYTVAPSPYDHPEKYTVAPVVAPSPYDHPEKYTVAPSPYGHPEKYTVAPVVAPSPYE